MRAPSLIATLGDALHFFEAIDDIDAELAAVKTTVNRSKEFTLRASARLRDDEEWLKSEKELCSKLVRKCERRLRRQYLVRVCLETALVPLHALFDLFWRTPRRALLRRKVQRGIRALDHCGSGFAGLQARIDSMDLLLNVPAPEEATSPIRKCPPISRRSESPRLRKSHFTGSTRLKEAELPRRAPHRSEPRLWRA